MRTTTVLACAIVAGVLILDAAHARPSPEAALSGGYSYNPPSGPRLNYLPQRRGLENRPRGTDVTIERVPLRLVHQSIEQHHRPHYHVYPSGPARRGPFHFPTGRQYEPHQRFLFPSGAASQQSPRNNDFFREQFYRSGVDYLQPKKDNIKPQPTAPQSTGYSYERPAVTLTTTEATPVSTTTPEPTTTIPEHEKPRITIAISKSTVIHTGKGSYQIDEKTGKPKPIIAEAHSYAGLEEPSSTPKPETGDNLAGEGTGNFPVISRGTPPQNEEPITESEDPISEPPATTTETTDSTTPNPSAPSDNNPYSTSWPPMGQHSYSVIAPGQAQFVSLGHVNPGVVAFAQNNLVPAYIQPEYAHPTYSSAYHPFAPAATLYYHPLVAPYNNLIEYAPSDDLCRGKVVPEAAAAPALEPSEKAAVEAPSLVKANRLVITKGGIAIAGPGGIADSGEGGTSIVGPGGTAYSSPNGVSIVGPGGKVVVHGDGTERILAKGPIVYYHQA